MGRRRADTYADRPLINHVAATSFVAGGSLFAIGAGLAQADVGGPLLPASVYLAGGAFFCSGGFASVLLTRGTSRLEQLSALVLFAGTLVFAINIADSFISELSPAQQDRLIWSPDVVGCALFLVSGHFAMVDLTGTWLPRHPPPGIGWWICVVNQVGSVLFMVSAIASFVHRDGDLLAAGIANWGTLTGALCFAIAGVMQEFERPGED
ncbi:MAG TPA: hypothetical protein VFJ57_13820 [Solirubrobacterales bacterium]|nr:hypothetical protein [Solirubrobacterales bacterium]